MVQTLEWFQCKSCGRRHRWSADIAGAEIECGCGAMVLCPELDVFDEPTASGTMMDAGDSLAAAAQAGEGDADHFPAELVPVDIAGGPPALQRKRGRGMWGMTEFQETVFWLIGVAVGFSLLMHAVIVQWWPYIVGTVIWAPIALFKFLGAKKRWQGNRSFVRAFEEEMGSGEEHGGV